MKMPVENCRTLNRSDFRSRTCISSWCLKPAKREPPRPAGSPPAKNQKSGNSGGHRRGAEPDSSPQPFLANRLFHAMLQQVQGHGARISGLGAQHLLESLNALIFGPGNSRRALSRLDLKGLLHVQLVIYIGVNKSNCVLPVHQKTSFFRIRWFSPLPGNIDH
jgi:hypothetical protein